MKPLGQRNYETHPITREELVAQLALRVKAVEKARKALDAWDEEHNC